MSMPRDRMMATLVELAEQLADPHHHHEPIVDRDQHRNRTVRRAWTTRQDGLLAQLAAAATERTRSGDRPAGARPVPGSRPPGDLEAMARYAAITIDVCRWCWVLRIPQRDTVEDNIRALVGAAPGLEAADLSDLLVSMRRWHHQAAVMTGWASRAFAPNVPCPQCDETGALRVNVDRRMAMCVRADCGAQWTPETIGVLGEYIQMATDRRAAQRTTLRSTRAGSGAWLPPGPIG
jgi:hypothetical protein